MLVQFSKDELEEKMKIDQEEFEKMTELEWEWELFRRTEIKEKLEKWIEMSLYVINEAYQRYDEQPQG